MTNVDRSSTNTGRLEFLRDGKGIYGLIGERPARWRQNELARTFVLRPDIIREGAIDDGLGDRAALHPLPRRTGLFKGTIEDDIRRDLGAVMIDRAGMFFDNGQHTASYDRKRVWGLMGRAECITNNLIGRLIEEAADNDALRLARRFPITKRAGIYRAATMSARFFQLAEVFPVLAMRVVMFMETKETEFGDVFQMVERGEPLRDVAEISATPMAFRKIPPGAVTAVGGCQPFFEQHPDLVHAYLPQTLPAIRCWLFAIQCAEQIGGPFTEWTARHATGMGNRLIEVHSLISDLRDWARASYAASVLELPEHIRRAMQPSGLPYNDTGGAQYVTRPFDPGMSLATVVQLSDEWHEAVVNGGSQHNWKFPEPWCPAGSVNGYEIIPITNGADLYREGKAMHHCVGTYGAQVSGGSIYIYSVRENGERIATAELVRSKNRARLGQVRGPCNKNVDKKIVAGVRLWLRQQNDFVFPAPPTIDDTWATPIDGDELPF